MVNETCPVCSQPSSVNADTYVGGDAELWVDCPYCGSFKILLAVVEDLAGDADAHELLPFLAAYIRQNTKPKARLLVKDDWKEYARPRSQTPISQRLRRLREIIASRSKIGAEVRLDERELAPWIDARDSIEVRFYLKHLVAANHISIRLEPIDSHKRTSSTSEWVIAQLQIAGWEAVSPVAGIGIPGTCFVAMSFNPALDDAYEKGIRPAVVEDCGFHIIRIDRVQHNDDITDRILAGIRTAQFVVADFSGQRQGVYFEAGFAAGLGRTVVWTCRARDFNRLHFDTRQRNHIRWTNPDDLRAQLSARIRSTIALPARLTITRRN